MACGTKLRLEMNFKSWNSSILARMGLLEQCRVSPSSLVCISASLDVFSVRFWDLFISPHPKAEGMSGARGRNCTELQQSLENHKCEFRRH